MLRGFFGGDGRDPFQHSDRMFDRMDTLFQDPFFHGPGTVFGQHRQVPVHARVEGPHIEEAEEHEISGDHAHTVEEPDDEDGPQHVHKSHHMQSSSCDRAYEHPRPLHQRHSQPAQQQLQRSAAPGSGVTGGRGFTGAYSYQSTSWSGGSGGMHHFKQTSARYGPGGVAEHRETIRDGHTGQESTSTSRHLGDRGYTSTHMRDACGRENNHTNLHNIQEHESQHFDAEWAQRAQHGLPNLGDFGFGCFGFGGRALPPAQHSVQPYQLSAADGQAGRSSAGRRGGSYRVPVL